MMPFALLAPVFIAAVGAVLIPLLVHLVHKEKKEALAFPSLMFLRKTPYPFSSRQRIRDWLLFLARCAIITLIAFAFARPVLARRAAVLPDGSGGREIVVLLDRSFSMQYASRWTRAQDEARKVIDTMGTGDQLTVVAFDRRASAVTEPGNVKAVLRAGVDSLKPTDEGTRLAPAIALATRLLSQSERPNRRLVVISDYQRSAWDLTDELTLPPRTEVVPVDVSGTVTDRSVRAVDVRRAAGDPSRVQVTARIAKLGAAERAVNARLEVGGRTVAQGTADLPQDGGAVMSLGTVPVPDRPTPARIVLEGDELRGDDTFHFLLSRAPVMPVLVVEHRDMLPERGVFLTRALEIGDAPGFDLLVRRSDRVTAADLEGRRVIVLSDAGVPASLGAARIEAFVRAGGGLLTALGERTTERSWPSNGRALLPGSVAAPSDRLGQRGAVLGVVDQGHPALSVFSGSRNGDLSSARFFRYRGIDTTEGVLARFDDGTAALTEHSLGRGRILTWASSFDGYWNDLPRQPVFLPFVHQLVRYAGAYREQRRAWSVGETVQPADLMGNTQGPVARWSVIAPSGARLAVGGDGAPAALELREAGIYQLRPSGAPNAVPISVAANVAPTELEFATFDVLRLVNALTPVAGTGGAGATGQENEPTLAEREAKQSLWWYILAVAALILAAEGLLARRASSNRLEPV